MESVESRPDPGGLEEIPIGYFYCKPLQGAKLKKCKVLGDNLIRYNGIYIHTALTEPEKPKQGQSKTSLKKTHDHSLDFNKILEIYWNKFENEAHKFDNNAKALTVAAGIGNFSKFKTLIEELSEGDRVELMSKYGTYWLCDVCSQGYSSQVTEETMKGKVKKNLKTDYEKIVKYLLELGIGINKLDENFRSPLLHAARTKEGASITRLLLDNGANTGLGVGSPLAGAYLNENYGGFLALLEKDVKMAVILFKMLGNSLLAWLIVFEDIRENQRMKLVRSVLNDSDFRPSEPDLHLIKVYIGKMNIVKTLVSSGHFYPVEHQEERAISLQREGSSFKIALVDGHDKVARQLERRKFLTRFDLFQLPWCKQVQEDLQVDGHRGSLKVLSEMRSSCPALKTIAQVYFLECLGRHPDRKEVIDFIFGFQKKGDTGKGSSFLNIENFDRYHRVQTEQSERNLRKNQIRSTKRTRKNMDSSEDRTIGTGLIKTTETGEIVYSEIKAVDTGMKASPGLKAAEEMISAGLKAAGATASPDSKAAGATKASPVSKAAGAAKTSPGSKGAGAAKTSPGSKAAGAAKASPGSKAAGAAKASPGSKAAGAAKASPGSKAAGAAKASPGSKAVGAAKASPGSKAVGASKASPASKAAVATKASGTKRIFMDYYSEKVKVKTYQSLLYKHES